MTAVRAEVTITDIAGTQASSAEGWTPAALGPNLVHWWDAHENVSYQPPTGAVSAWEDRAGGTVATQSSSSLQPIYLSTAREMRFTHTQALEIPGLSRPYAEHHWYAIVFRVNWDAITGVDGTFFSINGYSGGEQRQPGAFYTSATRTFNSIWRASPNPNTLSVIAEGDEVWHVIVSRRTPDGVYLSLDGNEESFLPCNPAMNLPNIGGEAPVGIIGDYRPNNIQFGINSIVIGQRDLDSQTVAKLQAWGMWRVGEQDRLPESHPYFDEVPPEEVALEEPPDGEDTVAFPSFDWDAIDFDNATRGATLDRTGFLLTFEEEWDDILGITEGSVGAGPWYTPARADTSTAHFRKPTQTFNPFSVDTPSVLTITMQKSGSTWYTGHVQTVNTFGEGFSQKYGYFEARLAFEDVPVAWPAFWLYSVDNQYKNTSATRSEIDIIEAYATDPDGYHAAVHRHPAVREQPGHLQAHTSRGEIEQLSAGANPAIWGISTLFDGAFHTYGVRIDADELVFYLDDKEYSRIDMYPEADVERHLLLTLQMQDDFVDDATSPARMYCDWIRVWDLSGGPGNGGNGNGDGEGFGAGVGGFGVDGFGA